MSPRRTTEHEEAIARRLAALSASLTSHEQQERGVAAPEESVSPWSPDAWTADHTRLRALGPVQRTDASTDRGAETGLRPSRAGTSSWEPTGLPRPGRHAQRRARRWAALLPPALRGGVALGAQHVAVVAVLACLGLALTSWWLVRSGTQSIVPVSTTTGTAPGDGIRSAAPLLTPATDAAPAPAAASSDQGVDAEVVVDVAGKVRHPGIVVLPAGSRVTDALEAAGGPRAGVDLTSLNLARPLVDGEQVLVGLAPASGAAVPPGPGDGTAPAGSLVNLNTADQAALETLPGVGPVTASAILGWREDHGGFTSVDELLEVDGIGEKTLATLAPLVTL